GTWTFVTKALCGRKSLLAALADVSPMLADSRLDNLRAIRSVAPRAKTMNLRLPSFSELPELVALSDLTLHSEGAVLDAVAAEAARQGRRHQVILMVELGELREGILPGGLEALYRRAAEHESLEVVGIGANLGCLSGLVPAIEQFQQMALYREFLELKFDTKLPLLSVATSVALPLLREGKLPSSANHFRIGDSVLLGSDLVHGGTIEGLRDDAFLIEAEVVEMKEKSLSPLGDTSAAIRPFADFETEDPEPGERGYRALVSLGHLDTDIASLTPIDPRVRLAGASSDLTAVNVAGDSPAFRPGDRIGFRPGYSALVRLLAGRYLPPIELIGTESDSPLPAAEAEIPVG
ncbi:MAG: alanine racemase, partial [Gemmatimonadetes bacterium]|nr:alanine racemase [Gemmatimonadota bacterium]